LNHPPSCACGLTGSGLCDMTCGPTSMAASGLSATDSFSIFRVGASISGAIGAEVNVSGQSSQRCQEPSTGAGSTFARAAGCASSESCRSVAPRGGPENRHPHALLLLRPAANGGRLPAYVAKGGHDMRGAMRDHGRARRRCLHRAGYRRSWVTLPARCSSGCAHPLTSVKHPEPAAAIAHITGANFETAAPCGGGSP
jgi:hypothetical protein